jgi:thiamine biosynthesis lipoprotein
METYVIAFRAMGCQMNVWLETNGDGEAILQDVPEWVESIEAILSRFRPDSELSQLNAHSGKWVPVSETLYENIVAGKRAAVMTNGLYNPLILPALMAAGYDRDFGDGLSDPIDDITPYKVPDWHDILINADAQMVYLPKRSQVDVGGVAKGWTAAQIAKRLAPYGACLIDAGGDLVGNGRLHNGQGWLVQVDDPFEPEQALVSIWLVNQAVVTSGTDYRRWGTQHHIIDPKRGQAADTDVLSTTVVCADAVRAEAYAKAVILKGSHAGLDWLNEQSGCAGLVVDRHGGVQATSNFLSFIAQ